MVAIAEYRASSGRSHGNKIVDLSVEESGHCTVHIFGAT